MVEGWSNYESWNVALWFDNDYDLYTVKVEWLKRAYRVDAAVVKAFVKLVLPNGTPDFDSPADYDKVNWDEVAENWKAEAEELAA
jgi:hypothetical protein